MEKIDNNLKNVSYEETTLESAVDKAECLDPEDDKHYDLVCCSEVIEHVNDQEAFMKECIRLVRPKTGLLFVSSIAKTPEGYFFVIFMGEKVLGLLPKGTHEYDMLINAETVEKFVHQGYKEVGVPPFKTVEKTGVCLANPLTMEMKEVPTFLRANYMVMF